MLYCVDSDIVAEVWSSLLPQSSQFKRSRRSKICGAKVSEQRRESCCVLGGSIGGRCELTAVGCTFPVAFSLLRNGDNAGLVYQLANKAIDLCSHTAQSLSLPIHKPLC